MANKEDCPTSVEQSSIFLLAAVAVPLSFFPACHQNGADTTLGKNPDDGLYFCVLLIVGTLFVSGSRCAIIMTSLREVFSLS